jgi:hypothetical protein
MFAKDELTPVLDAVDLLSAELKQLRSKGPHLCIVHRFRMPGTDCAPGEEIFAIFLVYRGRPYQVKIGLTLLILIDYLARYSRTGQTAAQIECGVRRDEFYAEHGSNASGRRKLVRRIPRSAVKELVRRLRCAFALTFHKAGLRVDSRDVVVAERTVSNQVLYKLQAETRWTHVDLTTRDVQPVWGGSTERRLAVPDLAGGSQYRQ